MQIERSKNYLYRLNSEIANTKALLNSYYVLCERKKQEAESLNNEISRLERLVSRFKSNDEEYLKINQKVQEEVRNVLTDGKVLLQFALASIIEAIRRNPDKYNNLLVYNSSSSSTAIISTQQTSSSPHYDEEYNAMILEVAYKLYSTLLKQLVNTIMDNTAEEFKNSSSQSKLS
jgi:autonomous glycyl radical cofactor GrcA